MRKSLWFLKRKKSLYFCIILLIAFGITFIPIESHAKLVNKKHDAHLIDQQELMVLKLNSSELEELRAKGSSDFGKAIILLAAVVLVSVTCYSLWKETEKRNEREVY